MATATAETPRHAAKAATGPHGAVELPSVVVTSYNLEVRDDDGFVGDKASRGAFTGVGYPGLIQPDGAIDRGAQNLPGNWESSRFNLVDSIRDLVPEIGDHDIEVLMLNDAVIQGPSEMPAMQDVENWAVLTIGTGLGNASYRNRAKAGGKARD